MDDGSELLLLVIERGMVKLQLVFLNLNRERGNSGKRLGGKRTRLLMVVWMMLIILHRSPWAGKKQGIEVELTED